MIQSEAFLHSSKKIHLDYKNQKSIKKKESIKEKYINNLNDEIYFGFLNDDIISSLRSVHLLLFGM